jgi:hypothetical protein
MVFQLRKLLSDAVAAFVVALVVTLVLASLSAAGVVDMSLATILLILAWVGAVVGTFLVRPIWDMTAAHKAVFAV